jgi:TatD DNase family protein
MAEEIPLEKLQLGSPTAESLQELLANGRKLGYVDVHAHLIHERFENKENEIAETCIRKGMDYVIVNGIEPISNRKILEFCNRYSPYMQPAIGIYPLDAANAYIYTEKDKEKDPSVIVNWKNEFPPPEKFNVDEEIAFIEEHAKAGTIIAIGECGLDKHYLTDDLSFAEQERVLRQLMKVSHFLSSFLLEF